MRKDRTCRGPSNWIRATGQMTGGKRGQNDEVDQLVEAGADVRVHNEQ